MQAKARQSQSLRTQRTSNPISKDGKDEGSAIDDGEGGGAKMSEPRRGAQEPHLQPEPQRLPGQDITTINAQNLIISIHQSGNNNTNNLNSNILRESNYKEKGAQALNPVITIRKPDTGNPISAGADYSTDHDRWVNKDRQLSGDERE